MQANLLDILGDAATPQLTITYQTRRNSTSEMRLRAEISSLINSYTVSLEGFKWGLNAWLNETSIGNNLNFWAFYKLKDIDNGIEVWHLNAQGDPDRQICSVVKKEVSRG